MITCMVCGGEEFEKHAGFMYCAVCQTQSQEYHEQEYDYQGHERNVIRRRKSSGSEKKTTKQTYYEDGMWTTWEGFNFILYGMTQEVKKCGANTEFENMVLRLWAAYLNKCQIAFISKHEKIPKLGIRFKSRDARILYNMDPSKRRSKDKKTKSKTSRSSVSTPSKRSIALQKGKIIAAEYQEHLSMSMQSSSNLLDDSLELLGTGESETTEQSSDSDETYIKSFKQILNEKDYNLLKDRSHSKSLLMTAKETAKRCIQCLGKNKLLSIIHLALLLTGSEIQLSDLLRFIRESHLSYAKVTHFFPNSFKFPKGDFSYIEVISDAYMPTHLHQRKITNQLALLLKVEEISTPNMNLLIDRYCKDLNLPKEIAELSKKILQDSVPPVIVPKSKKLFSSFESWAMVSIIFVMKLLFGLNDRNEYFLSRLARKLNSANNLNCFVFEDWQKFIECRKVVLTNYHYPTQEQLNKSSFQSSKYFLDTLMKESKDTYRDERFIPYSKYYINADFLEGIKQVLNELSTPQSVESFDFLPSLTPQTSHLEIILQNVDKVDSTCQSSLTDLSKEILNQNFKNSHLEFALDPKKYLDSLGNDFDLMYSSTESPENNSLLYNSACNYWILKYPDTKSAQLINFREEILKKTPENFQWLITECSRMLEMNIRDVYDELLNLEIKISLKPS